MTGPEYTRDLFIRTAHGITDESLTRALSDNADSLQNIITYVRREVVDVRSDPSLSPRGVQLKMPTVAQSGAARLIALTDSMKQLRYGIERSGAILSTARRHRLPENANLDDARWSEREARDRLIGMDRLEREAMYLQACERGDVASVRTFELAHPLFPLIHGEVIERGAEIFAKAAFPDEWEVLEQQKATLSLMDANLNNATAMLGTLCSGSTGAADPIAEMAGMSPAPEPS
jgi:hypothetical protein